MKVKPQTEIRNLKNDLEKLRTVCRFAGLPMLIIYLPDLVIKKFNPRKMSRAERAWVKQKQKEYKLKFKTTIK